MTEETAEEAAQRVNSKRNFSINPTMTEETAEKAAQRVNAKRLAANRESKKRKRAEESQEQCENRLASQREITKKIAPRNYKNNVKTGSRLKEKLPKERVPRKLLKELIQSEILV